MICLYIDPNTEAIPSSHDPKSTEWFGNGTCVLLPSECKVTEKANAAYTLRMVHPMTDDERWKEIKVGRVIRANVPVRDNPEGQANAAVTRNVYAIRANKKSVTLYQSESGNGKKRTCKTGSKFIALDESGSSRYYVMLEKGGETGYVNSADVVFYGTVSDAPAETGKENAPNGIIRTLSGDQFFRINTVEVNSYDRTVTVDASHIFYDANSMYVGYEAYQDINEWTVNGLIGTLNADAGIGTQQGRNRREYIEMHSGFPTLSGNMSINICGRNYTDILLNETDGILKQVGGRLVRDNYDAYILPMVVRDLGYTIRYAKNLQGITMNTDISSVVTEIMAFGKNKKGKYLGYAQRTSSNAFNYPVLYMRKKAYDVQIGKNGIANETQLLARLGELAQQEFDRDRVDEPTVTATIDFTDLGNTDEYAQYKALNALHIFDTVTITDNEVLDAPIKIKIVGYTWDCLTESYDSIDLGNTLKDMTLAPITSGRIPKISTDKLTGTVVADEVQPNGCVEYEALKGTAKSILDSKAAVISTTYASMVGDITSSEKYVSADDQGTTGNNFLLNGGINGNTTYGLWCPSEDMSSFVEYIYNIHGWNNWCFTVTTKREMVQRQTAPYNVGIRMSYDLGEASITQNQTYALYRSLLSFKICEPLEEGKKYNFFYMGRTNDITGIVLDLYVGDMYESKVGTSTLYNTNEESSEFSPVAPENESWFSMGVFEATHDMCEATKRYQYMTIKCGRFESLDDYGFCDLHSFMLVDVTDDETFSPTEWSPCKMVEYSSVTTKTKLTQENGFVVSGYENVSNSVQQIGTQTSLTPKSVNVSDRSTGTSIVEMRSGALPTGNGAAAGGFMPITIASTDWDNKTYTATIAGLSENAAVIASPAPASMTTCSSYNVTCTGQGAGYVTFGCSVVPNESVTINLLLLGGVSDWSST